MQIIQIPKLLIRQFSIHFLKRILIVLIANFIKIYILLILVIINNIHRKFSIESSKLILTK